MNPTAEKTKSEFEATKARLIRVFDATPEDRLNWSPSETSRTPIQILAHCGHSINWLHTSFAGKPMPKFSPAEFDARHMSDDKAYDSKEQVLAHLEEKSRAFVAWLEGLNDDQLATTWESPFGPVPLVVAITFPEKHTDGHVSQLEYLQTIYGDRVWH